MKTKYTGRSFEFDVSSMQVTDAVVTKDHISIDWREGDDRGHLEAVSADGVTYRGTFGYTRLNPDYHLEVKLYRAKTGEILIFGEWWQTDDPCEGNWVIHLVPTPE